MCTLPSTSILLRHLSSFHPYPLIITLTDLLKLNPLSVLVATDRLKIGLEAVHKTSYIPNVLQTVDSVLHGISIVHVTLSQIIIQ